MAHNGSVCHYNTNKHLHIHSKEGLAPYLQWGLETPKTYHRGHE